MNLSIGIIGLPNSGKSTLFNALVKGHHLPRLDLSRRAKADGRVKAGAKVSNFAFTTIDPNVGIVEVPDKRLKLIADRLSLEKKVPATIKFIDIAGLIKGAHKGEGLGNEFLSHIREVDAVVHVVRDFENSKVAHTSGKIDPEDDIKTVQTELELADLKLMSNVKAQMSNELKKVPDKLLLAKKPMIYVANISEKNIGQRLSGFPQNALSISAKLESEIAEMPIDDAKQYLESFGLKTSALDKLIVECYKLLDLITFYTLLPNQIQAWAIKKGSKAQKAAGKIHTDFEKGFIKAEVISCNELINYESWNKAHSAGRIRLEGKEYIVEDGDVILFKVKN